MEPQHSEPGTDLRRHSRDFPCPICGGRAETPKRQGMRCAGFTVGRVAYCTREQFAGYLDLKVSASPPAYRHTLSESCECGRPHGEQFFSPGILLSTTARPHIPKRTAVPIEERHGVYSAALNLLQLRDEAKDDLINRGLSPEVIEKTGYKSIPRRGEEHQAFLARMAEAFGEEFLRRCPGFANKYGRLDFWSASGSRDGYIVPYRDERGLITGIQQKTLGGKYLTARGSILELVYHLAGTGGPGQDLYVTEGATKATVANHLGKLWTFAVAGQSLTVGVQR